MIKIEEDESHNEITPENSEKPFQKIYDIDDDPKRDEFLNGLTAYWAANNRTLLLARLPVLGGAQLDLYKMWNLVIARRGLLQVILEKRFREIIKGLGLPETATSGAFSLRVQYIKFLYPYECHLYGFSTDDELQLAISRIARKPRSKASNTPSEPANSMPNSSCLSLLNSSAASSLMAASALQNPLALLQLMNNPLGLVEAAAALQSTNTLDLLRRNMMNSLLANGGKSNANNQPGLSTSFNIENQCEYDSSNAGENSHSDGYSLPTAKYYQPELLMNCKTESDPITASPSTKNSTMSIFSPKETALPNLDKITLEKDLQHSDTSMKACNDDDMTNVKIELGHSTNVEDECDSMYGGSHDEIALPNTHITRLVERERINANGNSTPSSSSGNESPPNSCSESSISRASGSTSTPRSSISQPDSGISFLGGFFPGTNTINIDGIDELCSMQVNLFSHKMKRDKNSIFVSLELNGVPFEGYVSPNCTI